MGTTIENLVDGQRAQFGRVMVERRDWGEDAQFYWVASTDYRLRTGERRPLLDDRVIVAYDAHGTGQPVKAELWTDAMPVLERLAADGRLESMALDDVIAYVIRELS